MHSNPIPSHPADGKFYVTLRMLREQGACIRGTQAFLYGARKFNKGRDPGPDDQLPVTLAGVEAVFSRSICGGFLLNILQYQGRLTDRQTQSYWQPNLADPNRVRAKAVGFMDALASAKFKKGTK